MEAEEDATSPVGLLTAVPGVTCWAQGLARGALGAGLDPSSGNAPDPWGTVVGCPHMAGITAPGSGNSAFLLGARTLQVVRLALNPKSEPGHPRLGAGTA